MPGEIDKVKSLLSEGADVNQKDVAEFTPLHCAVLGGSIKMVELLLENDANVQATHCGKASPLFCACAKGDLDIVKLLVNNGANIETKDISNWTALHYAATRGHIDIVEYLLHKGADIHAKCTWLDNGLTSLHLAARAGHMNVVKLLLSNGADVDAKTDKGGTPLSWAQAGNKISRGRLQMFRFLQDYRSLIRKELPELKDFGINLSPVVVNEKKILVCIFDIKQRPSRNCINQLSERAEQLKQLNITVIAVQASGIEDETFKNWIQENKISLSAGILPGNMEEKLRDWGVKAMPWLILTDAEHVVTAEGFNINELDERIKALRKK